MSAGDESIGKAQARSQPKIRQEVACRWAEMGWDGIGTWLACGVVSTGWMQPPSSFVLVLLDAIRCQSRGRRRVGRSGRTAILEFQLARKSRRTLLCGIEGAG